jgi:hypothetical protein
MCDKCGFWMACAECSKKYAEVDRELTRIEYEKELAK